MAVKKTQMYRKNLDTSETNLYPLTEAQYVSMENGQTVQEILSDRDSDKYTPVITNSSSTFKVGQGDNVDLSSSMKEGAYDSCVLKGKTMVNCIQEPSSQDVVLPYEFEDGQYVTINDTKESGALGVELKGQTLVNLFNSTLPTTNKNSLDIEIIPYKSNTTYTFIVDATTTGEAYQLGFITSSGSGNGWNGNVPNGFSKFTVTTTEAFNKMRVTALGSSNTVQINSIVILEGDYTNVDIPYFEGMQSVKMPILHTVGKNLATVSNVRLEGIRSNSGGHTNNIIMKNIPVEEGKTYTISGIGSKSDNMNYILFTRYEHRNPTNSNNHSQLWNEIGRDSNNTTFTIPRGIKYVSFTFGNCVYNNNGEDGWLQWDSIQLEEGSVATTYEPYKSSILSLPEEVVLRSLPNGVCDTFNTRTGVYTQRICELTLNGSNDESWYNYALKDEYPDVIGFYHTYTVKRRNSANHYIGTLAEYNVNHPGVLNSNEEGVNPKLGDHLKLSIRKDRLSSLNVAGFKQWLASNPIKIQYEMATPIVTKIPLLSTLKSWNTTTHIYSEIPENTLYPILSHSNPTYPVILKPSTKYSIVANSYSNNHTNSAINFNLGGATASTTVGNRVTTITTPSTLSKELLTMSGRGNKLNNVMVIEGDVVGDESYFEGICDCKSPILLNIGKNLFNINGEINEKFSNMLASDAPNIVDGNVITASSRTNNHHGKGQKIKIERGEKYTCSFTTSNNGCIIIHTPNKVSFTGARYSTFTFTAPTDCDEIIVAFNTGGAASGGKIYNLCVTKTETEVEYEPHKSNTTTFNQKDGKTIVLRSLPNGVCDTLNVETREYVQRIGDYTVNGTETSWFTYIDTTGVNNNYLNQTSCAFGVHLTGKAKGNGILCDKLPTRSIGWWGGNHTGEGICGIDNDNRIFLRVKNEKTGVLYTDNTSTALEKVKTYLASNPVTVQYELATPIVSTIDVQGFPYAYKDGHVQLSSGHDGQSLTPKVEYSLSANKTGQINSNTKRVSAHQKQLDDFEAMMLTAMVDSAYDKAILQFDYEMQMMSLGGE